MQAPDVRNLQRFCNSVKILATCAHARNFVLAAVNFFTDDSKRSEGKLVVSWWSLLSDLATSLVLSNRALLA